MASTGGRRDDWRTSSTGGGRAGPRAGGKGKGGRKWVVAALVVALLGGLLASLPLFAKQPVEPLVLALPVSEYHKFRDSRWPPNPWAEADARGLRDRFGGGSAQAFQNQEKAAIVRELASFVKRADDEKKPLVVYLTALGTVSGDTPYLLPADARPDDPASWLTLDDVLDPLRRGSTSNLLILDVRPARSPRAALPPSDVNELIDAKLAAKHQANDLPLLVLTANTPAAGPLVVPSHKHTAFGLALDRGVGGGADGWATGSKDGDVYARELAEYARETTHAVTGGTQRPQLYGQGGDFRLLTLPLTPPPLPEPEPRAYPPFLEDAWKDVEAAHKDGLHLRAPRASRQQTDAAVEAERWWLAGTADESVQGRYARTFADFKAELKGTTLAPPRPPVASVARARRLTPDFDKQQKAAEGLLRGVVTAFKSDAPAAEQKAELAKALAAFKEGLGKQNVPFPAAAAAVWAAAREQADLKLIRGLAVVAEDLPNATPTAELAALKLIADADPRRAVDWPADAVRQWMDATEAGEEAAVFDPRALPLVEKALAAADGQYRDGVKDLADTGLPDARMKEAVPNFQKARDGYKAVRAVTEAADFAWGQVEETRAALADLADRYPHELTRAPGLKECSLRDLTDAFSEVVGGLHPTGTPDAVDPVELKQAAQRLQDRRRALLTPIRLPAGNDPRTIEDALNWPGWAVADRKDLVGRLQVATAAAVASWPTSSARQELAAPASQRERVYGDSLRDLRNRVDLVRVWDAKKAGEFRADVGDGRRPPAERFSAVAAAVTAEVRDGPRKRADQDEWMRPLLGWAVDPTDRPALPADEPERNPEPAARRQADSRHAAWYAGRQTAMSTAVGRFARTAADKYSAVAAEVTK